MMQSAIQKTMNEFYQAPDISRCEVAASSFSIIPNEAFGQTSSLLGKRGIPEVRALLNNHSL